MLVIQRVKEQPPAKEEKTAVNVMMGNAPLSLQDTVSDRECCNVMCKCSGHEGVRGNRGPPGSKVTTTHTLLNYKTLNVKSGRSGET